MMVILYESKVPKLDNEIRYTITSLFKFIYWKGGWNRRLFGQFKHNTAAMVYVSAH